ncbi:MAG: DUF5719 family protein [Actinomycetota bacterium]|nr:DUF5719 family protein [Actinomycetota bacterium]
MKMLLHKVLRVSAAVFLILLMASLFACGSSNTAQAQQAPHIDRTIPSQGIVGTPVTIIGQNFGILMPGCSVTFNGTAASPITWQNTFIVTQVPEGATTGPVVVHTPVGDSNGVDFTVTATPPIANQQWYLAEGCTAYGFETYILLGNPNDSDATVNVIYNTEQYGSIPRPGSITVPAGSRVTLKVNDDIPNVNVSTTVNSDLDIVCERAMYWNNRIEGHESIGVTAASKEWYFAEGCTNWGYETWLLLQNPQVQDATVNITYMTPEGKIDKAPLTVPAGRRTTVQVWGDIAASDVSAKISSDQDIICERSMYWNDRRGGHDSIGATKANKTWYLAEGSTTQGFSSWLLLQNPSDEIAKVEVNWMTRLGPKKMPAFRMSPGTRCSIPFQSQVPSDETSVYVSSDKEIVAERSMYWNNGTGIAGHGTIGSPDLAKEIYFGEGSTAWGFETFLCIENPNKEPAKVEVLYLTGKGPVKGETRNIEPQSRVTVNVGIELPGFDTSIKLTSDKPIMAERAMYWNNRGAGHVSIGMMKSG